MSGHTSFEELKAKLEADSSWWTKYGLWGYNLRYWIKAPWKIPGGAWLHLRLWFWRWYQRGKRGYSDQDLWGLHYYLSGWLPKALREFKTGGRASHGWPGEPMTVEEWDEILEKMARAFEIDILLCDLIEAPRWDTPEYKQLEKEREEGLQLFIKWYNHLWD